jgi:hypothetical protein
VTPSTTAFLDANVIYSSVARNLLMYAHLAGTYRPLWSDAVHEEWIAALLLQHRHLTRGQLERTRDLMNQHAVGATVTGFESLIPTLTLPDPGDRHVLAAAIHGGASVIVTCNLRHFPQTALASYSLEALHPDAFVLRLFHQFPARIVDAARQHRKSLKNPPQSVAVYLASLEAAELVGTASSLKSFVHQLE